MSVNLVKHRDSLIAAWKDVLDDKTETNWALFGYDGQTNDLKVVSKGCGGIVELADDLNSSKIMYAFVKVDDPKTSLPKHVLINWQGEGANVVRKGMCANHLRDVENFLAGAHLTINARTEDEVDPEIIINQVAKSGSAYCFNRGVEISGPTKPIGTNYCRVNPVKEINAKERDQFWLQEEREEKKRLEDEHKRKELEESRREDDIKKREIAEAAERDAKNLIRDNWIEQTQKAVQDANKNDVLDKRQVDEAQEVGVNESELRKLEVRQLIAQRTIDAKSIFEQNTAVGQISKRVPEKPVRNSLLKGQSNKTVNKLITEDQPSDDESSQYSTIKRSPRDSEKKSDLPPSESLNHKYSKATTHMEEISDQQFVDEIIYHDYNKGLRARALYDYQAADDTEITFDPGNIITNIDQVDEGWWQGLGPDGTYGLFPANYVELIQ